MSSKRIGLAITGASGSVYGLRVLEELLRAPGVEIHLTISAAARKVLAVEHGIGVDLERFDARALGVKPTKRLVYHHHEDVSAPPASGSFRLAALAIVPCSMGCAGRIAHGISGDLVERAADVMLKERRPLVLVPRETPLSAIHLENLAALARHGATVLPAAPGFYGKPESVEDLIDFIVARVLDHLDVPHQLGPRWGERKAGKGSEKPKKGRGT
ncbi:MAG: UbiX family flavin prenyltransferase [Planctomycetes bacterium]|nr:UbiX family flavin prenyltransferase [Planctomycetota bacterium]